jgi:predicted dehydrogenase
MAQARWRVGVIGANGGTDRWGARAHLPAVLALEEAELTAVCTSREETARHAQERSGAALAFWDYEKLVRSDEVDLVTVSVRISLHHPIVLAALEAGKHVFCEWPLSLHSALATAMHTQAQAQGVAHAVGTQARFSPGIMYARELMAQHYVGRPLLFQARYHDVTALAAESQALQVAQLLRHFMRCIQDGTTFHPNFADAVSLHRTIEAIVRSSSTGRWEAVV